LVLALAASGTKIKVPSIKGTISLGFLFQLISISEFTLGESLLMGLMTFLVQYFFYSPDKPKLVQILFNFATVACSTSFSFAVHGTPWLHSGLLTAVALFGSNTILISIVIALTENKNAWGVWRESFLWLFPNYLAGAAAVCVLGEADRRVGWQAGLLLLPVLYLVYRSHRSWLDRLAQQTTHATEMAAVQRRTIEMLALAIEAKDPTTSDHLRRVETYAVEIGKELGIEGKELEALRAAALLHDIGKLAVPEYIIAKPGKLTREEFEKMKTHTVVGAEIVERIGFPDRVAPMVRGHHERWNGTGYPDGLTGDQIPVGARILAAVDCLDALASDRQYRPALPLTEAMGFVQSEAGKSFDPAVVGILARRYIEIGELAKAQETIARFPTNTRVDRGEAPAAGFEMIATAIDAISRDLSSLDNALGQGDSRELAELMTRISHCSTRESVFSILRTSLRQVAPYEIMVVYVRKGDHLSPDCVDGDDLGLFGQQENPVGEGLSGWVAQNGKAIVNGNPAVEPGCRNNPGRFDHLLSALGVPLQGTGGMAGVLSLYRLERDAFSSGDLKALSALSPGLAAALESNPEPEGTQQCRSGPGLGLDLSLRTA
jgi:putative nucleotidyltransferase with HDIG domain